MPTVLGRPLPRADVLSFVPILTSFSFVPLPSDSPSLPLTRCTSHHLPPCTQQLLPPSTCPFDPEPALRSSNLSLTLINVPETPRSHSPVPSPSPRALDFPHPRSQPP
ncbi:hypothetical protein M404DRAFT_28944 [Pisolithus tinctorius Marx 270]|uniref:Uncharacterized protein n=1 Tax=Pisolithus tinctorius Marx 270 TaxID=870435 RepID=A0A0C3IWK8_PISTI|nr:hypothetical protein M404DRAFT_28944 [Pisolithus tinctorius Marx 270]